MRPEQRRRLRKLAESLKSSDPTTGCLEGLMAVAVLDLLDGGDVVFAWVIERDESEGSHPEYFTGRYTPALRWSDPGDHLSACRFARKQDAETLARSLDGARPHRICEHGWNAAAPSGAAATGEDK